MKSKKLTNARPGPLIRLWTVAITFGLAAGSVLAGKTHEEITGRPYDNTPDEAKAKQAYAIGVQAYIWRYPMVVMQKSRDQMTKGEDAPLTPEHFNKSGLLFAPVNQVDNAWLMLGPNVLASYDTINSRLEKNGRTS